MFVKIAQKVTKHLGCFCNMICKQELSKIAHPGHTAAYPCDSVEHPEAFVDQKLSPKIALRDFFLSGYFFFR